MLGYLSLDIICSEKRTVFLELRSRKTVSFEEQIMSKDKYSSIFSQPNWGYCVYYPSVLKIGEYPQIYPSFSWGIFAHVTRLDQSRASKNIWWIINTNILQLGKSISWALYEYTSKMHHNLQKNLMTLNDTEDSDWFTKLWEQLIDQGLESRR